MWSHTGSKRYVIWEPVSCVTAITVGMLDVWHFTGRSWRLGFTVGGSHGKTDRDVPTSSFRFPGGCQSAPKCRLIRIQNPRQQLDKSAVRSLLGINGEMVIFV